MCTLFCLETTIAISKSSHIFTRERAIASVMSKHFFTLNYLFHLTFNSGLNSLKLRTSFFPTLVATKEQFAAVLYTQSNFTEVPTPLLTHTQVRLFGQVD